MERLIRVQKALKAPKGQYNSFGKYAYRSCEDILEAVKPLLAKEGLAIIIEDALEQVGERYYVRATVSIFADEKKVASATAYAREEETKKGMDGSQITGAASSYARKYALNGLFAIDDAKDSDSTNTHEKEAKKPEENPLVGEIRNLYLKAKARNGQADLDEALGMNLGAVQKVMKSGDENKMLDLKSALEGLS